MPCGCEGHADNEHLCRYPALKKAFDAQAAELKALKEKHMPVDPETTQPLNQNKYTVTRSDGSSAPGQKHERCEYYVLDLKHDKFAKSALQAYAAAASGEFPLLAADLQKKLATL